MHKPTMWGVYRVAKNGKHYYVSRSATHNEKLARSIADDLTNGRVILPTGQERFIKARPHIAKPIGDDN